MILLLEIYATAVSTAALAFAIWTAIRERQLEGREYRLERRAWKLERREDALEDALDDVHREESESALDASGPGIAKMSSTWKV